MIRIDEIYYNVFAKSLQDRPRVGLHWFDPFGSVRFDDLVNFPQIHRIPDLRLIFWDQEPVYKETTAPFMQRFLESYTGTPMIVCSEIDSKDLAWVCDTYMMQSCHYFFHGWAALDWYRGYNHSFLPKSFLDRDFKSKLFCPNNIVSGRRSHRLFLLDQFYRAGLIESNHISFPDICPYSGQTVEQLFNDNHLTYPSDLNLPLVIDCKKNHANDSHRIDFWDHAQESFCHIVTETVFDDDRVHLTEKIFKPVVLQQPFLLVGPKHGLQYLKSYGFKTFDKIWDESYDQMSSQDRLVEIVKVAETVNNWTAAELRDATAEVRSTVEHNFQWFYGGFQDVLWNELKELISVWRQIS